MANRAFMNFGHMYANQAMPAVISLKFTVDSANVNGLGISSLKSNGYVRNVFMNSASPPAGSPAMGIARSYAILGASAVSNTGSSVLTGNLGIYPGTSVTGFPPGTFSGQENIANAAALAAKSAAQASYTDLQARSPSIIASALDGQSLTAGVYKSGAGTFTLANAGAGTLTLTGSASDIFVFQTTTTLITGAGGVPTITLVGGAKASNIYWVVGSSATINSGFSGVFKGNVIANTSITDTLGGTVNGSLIALNGAVTLSAASIINSQPLSSSALSGNPNPEPGVIIIHLADNYRAMINQMSSIQSPLSGSDLAVNGSALTVGNPYVISVLGSASEAEWHALGVPAGVSPAVGVSFIALLAGSGASASSKVQAPSVSGVNSMEIIGNPNVSLGPQGSSNQGGYIMLQSLANEVLQAPLDGSVINISFLMDNSSVTVDGL